MTETYLPLCIIPEDILQTQRRPQVREVLFSVKTCTHRKPTGSGQFKCELVTQTVMDYREVCPVIQQFGTETVLKAVATQPDGEK